MALKATAAHWFHVVNHCNFFLDSVNSYYETFPRRHINVFREKITTFQINSVNLRSKIKGFRIVAPFAKKHQSGYNRRAGLTMNFGEEASMTSQLVQPKSQRDLLAQAQRKALETDSKLAANVLRNALQQRMAPNVQRHLNSLFDILAQVSADLKTNRVESQGSLGVSSRRRSQLEEEQLLLDEMGEQNLRTTMQPEGLSVPGMGNKKWSKRQPLFGSRSASTGIKQE